MLEVELKFRLADEAELAGRLAKLGATAGETVTQFDAYYNHPSRDFAETDEALRIRSVDGVERLTYKGPKHGGATKSREEIELPLSEGSGDQWCTVLRRLGFRAVKVVRKRRTPHQVRHRGREFEVAIDRVDGVGTFVEVETVVAPAERLAADADLLDLAAGLGLVNPEPRSYLEMLLDAGDCA